MSEVSARAHVASVIPDKANRPSGDFYRTPPEGTSRLLCREKFPGIVWECACGDGSMARELEMSGSTVVGTDLTYRGYGAAGVDFLSYEPKFTFDHIITNPPFAYVQEFAERALSHRPTKVALLARLLWLESKRRRKFFETSGLARVYVFSGRINVARNAEEYSGGGMIAYAWYVWERGFEGPPTLEWI